MSAPLSVEYTPLSASRIKVGQVFHSGNYVIRQASHDKAVAALFESVAGGQLPWYRKIRDGLLSSELWGWARALSPTFGRLNEVVLSKATWEICDGEFPGRMLYATTEVMSIEERHGLVFCTMQTETFATDGKLLLRAVDEVLLAHDCKKPFFKEPSPRFAESFLLANTRYDDVHTVYFRWPWDESVWKNNIHTDQYAIECGFERGLPEFVTYMDWIEYAVDESNWFSPAAITVQLVKVLPLYHGEKARVVTYRNGENGLHVLFLNKDGAERVRAVVTQLVCAHL